MSVFGKFSRNTLVTYCGDEIPVDKVNVAN